MEEVKNVLNLIVKISLKEEENLVVVKHTEEVKDVLIVLLGLIQELELLNMMVIVLLVLR